MDKSVNIDKSTYNRNSRAEKEYTSRNNNVFEKFHIFVSGCGTSWIISELKIIL